MTQIFVSYSRDSEAIVRQLVNDLEEMGHRVWFDQELSGGQAWWDQILGALREAGLVLFVVHPRSLASVACARERSYATALGKPILPVQVAEGISINLLPPDLAQLQIVRYLSGSATEVKALARSLGSVPPAPPLPSPLPPPPEVPSSYLGVLAMRIDGDAALSYQDQSAALVDLRQALREADTRVDADILLGRLRKRRDLFAAIAEEIDALRDRTMAPAAKPPASEPANKPVSAASSVDSAAAGPAARVPGPAAAPTPAPTPAPPMPAPQPAANAPARLEAAASPSLRSTVSMQGLAAPVADAAGWRSLRAPWLRGVMAGLVLGFGPVLLSSASGSVEMMVGGAASLVFGAWAGSMAGRDVRTWVLAAIGFGLGCFIFLNVERHAPFAAAAVVGGLPGATVAAALGWAWRRWRQRKASSSAA